MPLRRTRRSRKGGGWYGCGKYFCGVDDIASAKQAVYNARNKELYALDNPTLQQVTKIVRDVCYASGGNSKFGKCNGTKINDANAVRVDDVAQQILEDLKRAHTKTPARSRRSPPKRSPISSKTRSTPAVPGSLISHRLAALQGQSMGVGDGTHSMKF
jgi:hypothetical protein